MPPLLLKPAASRPLRHESKFTFPAYHLPRVEALLDHQCATDPAFPTNCIKSLYFDTDRLELLRQKQASEFLKRKVRIRWYVDPRTGTPGADAFLEVKTKQGAAGGKQRTRLPLSAATFDRDPLAAAAQLLREADPEADPYRPLQGLVPACVIQYRRRRFIDLSTGHRIALDADIRASAMNRALFRVARECRPGVAVLEIKGAGARDLPPSLSLLYQWGVHKTAFSKYAACVDGNHPMEIDPL